MAKVKTDRSWKSKIHQRSMNLIKKRYRQGKIQIAEGKNKLIDSEEKLNLGKQQAANNISSSISLKVARAKKQLDSDPTNEFILLSIMV